MELVLDARSQDSALKQIQDFFEGVLSGLLTYPEVKITIPPEMVTGELETDAEAITGLFKDHEVTVVMGHETPVENPDAAALKDIFASHEAALLSASSLLSTSSGPVDTVGSDVARELIVDKDSWDSALLQITNFLETLAATAPVTIKLPEGIDIGGEDIADIVASLSKHEVTVAIGVNSVVNPDEEKLIDLIVNNDPQFSADVASVGASAVSADPASLEVDPGSETSVLEQIRNFLADPDIKVDSKVEISFPEGIIGKTEGSDLLDIISLFEDYEVSIPTTAGSIRCSNLNDLLRITQSPISLEVDAASETSVLDQIRNFLAEIADNSDVKISFPPEGEGGVMAVDEIKAIQDLLDEHADRMRDFEVLNSPQVIVDDSSSDVGGGESSSEEDETSGLRGLFDDIDDEELDSPAVLRQVSGEDDDISSSDVGGGESSSEEDAASSENDDDDNAIEDASAREEAKEKLVFRLDILNTGMLLNEQFGHHIDSVFGSKYAQDVAEGFLAGSAAVIGHIGGMDNYYYMPLARALMFFANKYGRTSIEDSFKYYLSESIGEEGAVLVGDLTVGVALSALSVHPVFTFGVMAMSSVSKYSEVEQSTQAMTTGALIAGVASHYSGVGSIYEVASAAITGMHAGNAINGFLGNSIEDTVDSLVDAVGKITPTQLFEGTLD